MRSSTIARRTAATVAAGAAIACAATAAPADAAVPHHGKIYFVIGSTSPAATPVVIMHGAQNAIGKDPESSSDNYDVLYFTHGRIRITHPATKAKYVNYINKKTCYSSFTEIGTFTLGHGTGRYAGIHGKGSYVSRGSFFLARTKSGACDENSNPRAEVFTIRAHGRLK